MSHSKHRNTLATVAATLLCSTSSYALTDLSDAPLFDASSVQVKPNILFVFDDSGSMQLKFMPDDLFTRENKIGFRNHQCNLVYYNPGISYAIPKDAGGTNLNNASQTSFTNAYEAGFWSYTGEASTRTNLSGTNFRAFDDTGPSYSTDENDAAQPAYYWKYLGSTTLVPLAGDCEKSLSAANDSATTEYCTDNTRRTTTSCASVGKTALWRKIVVSSTSGPSSNPNELQNFANWYSYYRTRMMMMKSSSGRAISPLTDSYRLGFMTIHPGTFNTSGAASGSDVDGDKFLKIADFSTTQRNDWYDKLYSQGFESATPLRSALSVAGRYYAGKNDTINRNMVPSAADDPVQYSCQQNFTILTTDGYWNNGGGRKLDGSTAMDNQDGVIAELDAYTEDATKKFLVSPRPIYDGASATYVWNTATTEYQSTSCAYGTQLQQRSRQYQSCSTTGSALESRTSSDGGSAWPGGWATHSSSICESDNAGNSRRECRNGTITATRTTSNGNSSNPNWSGWAATSSCSEDASGGDRRECRREIVCNGTWTNAQCTNTNLATYPICRSTLGSWSNATSCTPSAQNGSGVATECQTASVSGFKLQSRINQRARTYDNPDHTGTPTTDVPTNGTYADVDGICHATIPAIPPSAAYTGSGPPAPPSGCSTWPCDTYSSTGGTSDTLADVAQYYYKTDLRTSSLGNCTGALGASVNVCNNFVTASGSGPEDNKAQWQHMTTFTMGLGLSGTLNFIVSPNYKTPSGDFVYLRGATPIKNWPTPTADSATALDDLWHAAVNGRGEYFSAGDPDSVISGLSSAFSSIDADLASAAAAATSNLEPVAGDNFAYTAKYRTQEWTGELESRAIDLSNGTVSGTPLWSAQGKLDLRSYLLLTTSAPIVPIVPKVACDTRVIKLFRTGATNNLVDFKWNTDICNSSNQPSGSVQTTLDASEQAYFTTITGSDLSQYSTMSATQRTAAAGSNLVNFIRGHRSKEDYAANNDNQLYRTREHILGDIVSAQPVYVKAPFAEYDDAGYAGYKAANANRAPRVYAAANDGMLHAFNAAGFLPENLPSIPANTVQDPLGGNEEWAFIPTMVLPNLSKLASNNYANTHMYYVDGTPAVGDVFDTAASTDCALPTPTTPASCWKTILVGGLNKGGKGYYALDISDPNTPKALWEFKYNSTCYNGTPATAGADCHLGYTFNNPVIAKLAGKWVVFVTSGYNNVTSPTPIAGDGQGYLYVLDAMTGKIIYKISTSAGSSTSPSGLNHINVWTDNGLRDNTAVRVYGVDLLGNIWRFDVNNTILPAGREATLLAQVVDSAGNSQPITTRPELAESSTNEPFVYVATGRYLGVSDLSITQTQSIWAIRDPLSLSAVTSLRSTLARVVITNVGTGSTAYRTNACVAPCNTAQGWYVDLPDSGERVNVDIKLQLGSLIVASNVPDSTNPCDVGGYSWLNFFNYANGLAVGSGANSSSVGQKVVGSSGKESVTVGFNIVRLPGGKTVVIVTNAAAENPTIEAPFKTPDPSGKRISWREVVQ